MASAQSRSGTRGRPPPKRCVLTCTGNKGCSTAHSSSEMRNPVVVRLLGVRSRFLFVFSCFFILHSIRSRGYSDRHLAAYPLILSDDAGLFVYHAACAAALATEILVDLYTYFRPPEPYHQLFVLDPIRAAPKHPAGRESKELTHAMVNGYPPD